MSCVLLYGLCFDCSQVCDLTGELYSVQEERDNLVSAQAVSHEDCERLRGEAVKVQEELEKLQTNLADSELKNVQQYTETTEQLVKVQTDLQHLLEEKESLLSALEEAQQKVGTLFVQHFNLKSLIIDLL